MGPAFRSTNMGAYFLRVGANLNSIRAVGLMLGRLKGDSGMTWHGKRQALCWMIFVLSLEPIFEKIMT